MTSSNKQKGNAGGTIGAVVCSLVAASAPIVVSAIDKIPAKRESKTVSELVAVPDLCAKGFPLTLEQAKEKLASVGLKVMPIELTAKDAAIKYRDYLDGQVVASNPRSKTKVKSGTMIDVCYITQGVIDQSRKMFEEDQKRKLEEKTKSLSPN